MRSLLKSRCYVKGSLRHSFAPHLLFFKPLSLPFVIYSSFFFEVLIIDDNAAGALLKGQNYVHAKSVCPFFSPVPCPPLLIFPLLSLFFLTLSYFLKLSLCFTSSSLVHCLFFSRCKKQLYSFCPQGSFILTHQGSSTQRSKQGISMFLNSNRFKSHSLHQKQETGSIL